MDQYIIKNLLKKNKKMSRKEAEKRAQKIWNEYCKSNKDRNERREEEFKKEVDNALQLENDTIAFDYLSKEELMEYFKVKK